MILKLVVPPKNIITFFFFIIFDFFFKKLSKPKRKFVFGSGIAHIYDWSWKLNYDL